MATDPDELRRQLAAIDAQFPGVTSELIELTPEAMVDRIAENDAAVFLPPLAFGYSETDEFPEPLPCVEVECGWLEELIVAGKVDAGRFGIGNHLGPSPELLVPVDWFGFFHLSVAPVYVWFTGAPEEWLQAARRRFRVLFPDHKGDGLRVHMTTGPMEQYGDDTPRWFSANGGERDGEPLGRELPGRNDPCWCGSGTKFKRCHGA